MTATTTLNDNNINNSNLHHIRYKPSDEWMVLLLCGIVVVLCFLLILNIVYNKFIKNNNNSQSKLKTMTTKTTTINQKKNTTIMTNNKKPTSGDTSSSSVTGTGTGTNINSGLTSVDAWEERRQRGIVNHSLHVKKDYGTGTAVTTTNATSTTSTKPFGSSYYYAHNSTKTTGGYKDGLRMEDYTMNQPRLLSKGTVQQPTPTTSQPRPIDTVVATGTTTTTTTTNNKKGTIIIPISKYLWDDPGLANGIATIRIDQLPKDNRTNSEYVPWEQANITNPEQIITQIHNKNEGLLVLIHRYENQNQQLSQQEENSLTMTTTTTFKLQIDQLYGPIQSIQVSMKSKKRLLIQIVKKSSMWEGKKNCVPWPHPQKKKR